MARRLLFASGQAATTAFCLPLWRRWRAHGAPVEWRVAAAPVAMPGDANIAAVACESDAAAGLAALLGGWHPDAVVMSASAAPIDHATLMLARSLDIPVARIVDTWYGYGARLRGADGGVPLPDQVLVIDAAARRQAVAEGIPADLIVQVGQPAWEGLPPLPPADPRRVLFVGQPVARYKGDSLGYTENTAWNLLGQVAQARPDLVSERVYAPHPEETTPPPAGPRARIAADSRAALAECGTVVGMFSSLLLDAVLQGRRVISLQPGATGPNLAEFGRPGLLPVAHDAQGLEQLLQAADRGTDGDLRQTLAGSCDRFERFCTDFAWTATT